MSAPASDRNLLLGLLALQMDFLGRDALVDAMLEWMRDKARPLGRVLRQRGALNEEDEQALERLVDRHVARHGGDPRKSLASLRVDPDLRHSLGGLGDAEVHAGLTQTPEPEWPATPAPGRVGPALETGRFRRLRHHAQGGLGEVHVALDEQLGREVALKEIQDRYADHPDSRTRFLREARITGALEHPGVVPVYGLGAYPDGRPYYAMRFIHGSSLDEAIRRFHQAEGPKRDTGERALALRGLLSRFVVMCNAVAYAHARGVIHRDLKPANVMLGEFGETLVVDWGLARVLVESEGEGTRPARPLADLEMNSEPTRAGDVMGTPAFMPPEQARGEVARLGPRSDVWALGATLYAILTGRAPYRGEELVKQAEQGRLTPPRQVSRQVPPGLQAVCLKAMAAEPEARYPTARTLAEEVERWLADEAPQAYQEPWVERARRWRRRHRALTASAILALFLSVIASSIGLWAVRQEQVKTGQALTKAEENFRRASKAEKEAKEYLERAEGNLDLARKAVNECFDIAKAHPLLQDPKLRQVKNLLLAKALPFYENFRAQRPDDPKLAWQVADYHLRVGHIHQETGRPEEALRAYRQAQTASEKIAEDAPTVWANQVSVARAHHGIGTVLWLLVRHEEALEAFRQAQEVLARPSSGSGQLEYQKEMAFIASKRASVLSSLGRQDEALNAFSQARDHWGRLVARQPAKREYLNGLALTHNNRAILLSDMRRHADSLAEYRLAREAQKAALAQDPHHPETLNDLAGMHSNIANELEELGRRDEALLEYGRAIEVSVKLTAAHPDVPMFRSMLAVAQCNRGLTLRKLGKEAEANELFQQALALQVVLVRSHRRMTLYRQQLAHTHVYLGTGFGEQGRHLDAAKAFEHARILWADLAAERPTVVLYQQSLGTTCQYLAKEQKAIGRDDLAIKSYEQARNHWTHLTANYPGESRYRVELADVHSLLGTLLREAKKRPEALREFERACHLMTKMASEQPGDPDHLLSLVRAHRDRSGMLWAVGRRQESVKAIRQSRDVCLLLVTAHPGVPDLLVQLAFAHRHHGGSLEGTGRHDEALREFRSSRNVWEKLAKMQPGRAEHRAQVATMDAALGDRLSQQGKHHEAWESHRLAHEGWSGVVAAEPKDPDYQSELASTCSRCGYALLKLGRRDEAVKHFEEALRLWSRLTGEYPSRTPYRKHLGNAHYNLGLAQRRLGQFSHTCAQAEQAIRIWAKLVDEGFPDSQTRRYLLDAHRMLADAKTALGQHQHAVEAWEEALRLVPAELRHSTRIALAIALARAGNPARGAEEARIVAENRNITSKECYDLSRALALVAAAVSRDAAVPLPVRNKHAGTVANEAIEQLRRAQGMSHFGEAANRKQLDTDPDLVFLRSRDEYRIFRDQLGGR